MQYQQDDRTIAVWIGRSQYERDNDHAVRLHQCTQRSGDRYRNRLSDREIAMLPSFSDRWIAVNIYAMQKHVCTSMLVDHRSKTRSRPYGCFSQNSAQRSRWPSNQSTSRASSHTSQVLAVDVTSILSANGETTMAYATSSKHMTHSILQCAASSTTNKSPKQ